MRKGGKAGKYAVGGLPMGQTTAAYGAKLRDQIKAGTMTNAQAQAAQNAFAKQEMARRTAAADPGGVSAAQPKQKQVGGTYSPEMQAYYAQDAANQRWKYEQQFGKQLPTQTGAQQMGGKQPMQPPIQRAKGGKVKPVSVDMEGLEAMTRSMRPAVKDDLETKVMQASNLAATRKRETEETAPKKQSFNQAFGAARERGDKTFSWNGGSYGTQLKGETPKAAPRAAAPAPRAAAPRVVAPAAREAAPAPRAAAARPLAGATSGKSQEDYMRERRDQPAIDAFLGKPAATPTARSAATPAATPNRVGFQNAKDKFAKVSAALGDYSESAKRGDAAAKKAIADRQAARMAEQDAKIAKAKKGDPRSAGRNLNLALANLGFSKGGKVKAPPKSGLAVMIAIGKPMKPTKKMNGGPMAARSMDMESSKLTRQMAGGGNPMGYAAGGAGKTRKGQAPIKKAQGGAAKVRKGMMTPEGKITHAMNKIRGE